MIKNELDDNEAPKEIRQFIKDNEHILFTKYVDRGFNGKVYFGKRIKMNEDVVIKFYLANKPFDASEEALILRKIQHPNILKVDDIKFLEPWNTYFLSPLITGGDLQALIDTETISSSRALNFVQKLLLGLNELHSEYSLVHRDLKPANLLFNLDDDNPIIADLGSVKKIENPTDYTTASRCTNLYLPPEAINNNRYSIRSDIYQMGIVFYQLLGGFFPLQTPTQFLNARELKELNAVPRGMLWNQKFDALINDKIIKGKLLDINSLPICIPAKFKSVIRKACHPDDAKRYGNASEFLTDVNKLIRNYPCYEMDGSDIKVTHKGDRQYKIRPTNNGSYIVSKQIASNPWRRVKTKDGSLKEVITATLKP